MKLVIPLALLACLLAYLLTHSLTCLFDCLCWTLHSWFKAVDTFFLLPSDSRFTVLYFYPNLFFAEFKRCRGCFYSSFAHAARALQFLGDRQQRLSASERSHHHHQKCSSFACGPDLLHLAVLETQKQVQILESFFSCVANVVRVSSKYRWAAVAFSRSTTLFASLKRCHFWEKNGEGKVRQGNS